jgi:hypothetical protein
MPSKRPRDVTRELRAESVAVDATGSQLIANTKSKWGYLARRSGPVHNNYAEVLRKGTTSTTTVDVLATTSGLPAQVWIRNKFNILSFKSFLLTRNSRKRSTK